MSDSRGKIYFRADFSGKVGLGHIRRVLILAEELFSAGFEIKIFTRQFELDLQTDFFLKMKSTVSCEIFKTESDFLTKLKEAPPQLLVIDLLDLEIYEELKTYLTKKQEFKIACFDFFSRDTLKVDFIFQPFFSEKIISYPHSELLKGPEYFILSPENIQTRVQVTSHRPKLPVQNILVTLGGSDPTACTARLLHAICPAHSQFNFRAIIGPAFSPEQIVKIQKMAADLPNLELLYHPESLGPSYNWADFALISGGTTKYEVAFFGLPNLIFAQNSQEESLSLEFEKLGSSIYAGAANSVDSLEVRRIFSETIANTELLQKMAARGPLLVDGQGSMRLVEFIKEKILITS